MAFETRSQGWKQCFCKTDFSLCRISCALPDATRVTVGEEIHTREFGLGIDQNVPKVQLQGFRHPPHSGVPHWRIGKARGAAGRSYFRCICCSEIHGWFFATGVWDKRWSRMQKVSVQSERRCTCPGFAHSVVWKILHLCHSVLWKAAMFFSADAKVSFFTPCRCRLEGAAVKDAKHRSLHPESRTLCHADGRRCNGAFLPHGSNLPRPDCQCAGGPKMAHRNQTLLGWTSRTGWCLMLSAPVGKNQVWREVRGGLECKILPEQWMHVCLDIYICVCVCSHPQQDRISLQYDTDMYMAFDFPLCARLFYLFGGCYASTYIYIVCLCACVFFHVSQQQAACLHILCMSIDTGIYLFTAPEQSRCHWCAHIVNSDMVAFW